MQFIADGPDIPDSLLQAHEDGRVVFFCGAGVSYPAGLPGFGGLVSKIYELLGAQPDRIEQDALDKSAFDTAIELLERRHPGHREEVRRALTNALTPNLRQKKARATHKALLQLAQSRTGQVRLVTTNFDRLFESSKKLASVETPSYAAPLLPIPKPSRWDGIVYLHGLLSAHVDSQSLNRLVISSGDFGLAYLTERWAARFVSDLFRNFVVCFVGYSINDPVLRYMRDALAADRLLGEETPQAYAFGSDDNDPEKAKSEWISKGVQPILYSVREKGERHAALHETLIQWAEVYRSGSLGKEAIVAQYAPNAPSQSTSSDDYVGRVLWALSDSSGLPAKRFAELDPAPPIEWLDVLDERRFSSGDLGRFSLSAADFDSELTFSLLRRPCSGKAGQWVSIVNRGAAAATLDAPMEQLARWLLRHVNNPKLVLWVARSGGRLHPDFRWKMRQHLDGRTAEHDRSKSRAVPLETKASDHVSAPMRKLWELALANRLESVTDSSTLFDLQARIKKDGITPILRAQFRDAVRPIVRLSEPFELFADESNREKRQAKPKKLSDLVRWEVALSALHVHSTLGEKRKNRDLHSRHRAALLPDASAALLEVMELRQFLGDASATHDHSYSPQPSISDHSQNRRFHDWTALIDLARDGWLALWKSDSHKAKQQAEAWWNTPFPVFKRLALFAATKGDFEDKGKALEWLLGDKAWWLWSTEMRREVMRYLASTSKALSSAQAQRLESAILKGPLRSLYPAKLDSGKWRMLRERQIWLYLSKLKRSGFRLSARSSRQLRSIQVRNPAWKLHADQREEFPVWMSSSSDISHSDQFKQSQTPVHVRELVNYVKTTPTSDFWTRDDWRLRCSKDYRRTSAVLRVLGNEGIWPVGRWMDAFQAWLEPALLQRSWRQMAVLLRGAPDSFFEECAHGLATWMQAIGGTLSAPNPTFIGIAWRILSCAGDKHEASTDDPVGQAINDPIGQVTEAVARYWFAQKPKDGDGLPDDVEAIFTAVCDCTVKQFRHGRVLLGAHALALFRVDSDWAEFNLLPLFDWQISHAEAKNLWEGFMWTPRVYPPLVRAMREETLSTAFHFGDLGDHAGQFADYLTFAALEPSCGFTNKELARAFGQLPESGLKQTASALARALAVGKDQRAENWGTRVQPFVLRVWPKQSEKVTPGLAESVARLALAAEDQFPCAFELLNPWLIPLDYPDFILHLVREGRFAKRFPGDVLAFIGKLISVDRHGLLRDLGPVLEELGETDPTLKKLATYRRLSDFVRLA